MRPIVLFEDDGFRDLLPLVYWRSVFELRVGRKIMLDRIAQQLGVPISGVWTRDWMAAVAAQRCGAPANRPMPRPGVLVNGRWLFDGKLDFPQHPCVARTKDGQLAYIVCDQRSPRELSPGDLTSPDRQQAALEGLPTQAAPGRLFRYPWELIAELRATLLAEWTPDDATINSDVPGTSIQKPERVHIGERVRIHPTAVLDAAEGPIHISDDVTVGPCAVLEGPAYIGPGTRINPHAWLHGGNAVGPVCRIGGEVHASILNGYTNKQHLGFLGHAYVGSWVNIGAGATNSNLKNTYGMIRVPVNGKDIETGQQFFGAIIGDHAKIGINAAIPTGCVIGFGASAATTGLLPKFVRSFAWITRDQISAGDHLRALDVATAVMARRKMDMTDEEVELFLELGRRVGEFERPAQ